MWFDTVRPFAPGLKKFILGMACLQTVAIALMVNVTVALALVATLAACLVKIYQVDPEPVLLLLMHTAISTSMLFDPTTTFALITVVVASVVAFGDYDLPTERVLVVGMSIATTAIFGKFTACVASLAIAVVIVFFKLRPLLQPPALCLLALGSQAMTVFVSGVAGFVVIFIFMAIVTALFVINKVTKNRDLPHPESRTSQKNLSSHPNGYLPLSNPTESLDLHGHTVTGAMKVLHAFLREHEDEYRKNRAQHVRHVTIVTGDGNQSNVHDASNLVKPTVVNFLKINKYRYDVPSDSPGLIKVDLESHAL